MEVSKPNRLRSVENDTIFPFVVNPKRDPSEGQVQFCHNLIVNLFQK